MDWRASLRIVNAIALILATVMGSGAPTKALAADFSALEGSPDLRSASALVTDAEGNVIYGKDIDAVRPISNTFASTFRPNLDSQYHPHRH